MDQHDASIIEAIVAMGHGLKLKVVAEGIETIEQYEFLAGNGCDEAQGYLYSTPVDAKQFARLLAAESLFIEDKKRG